MNIFHLHKDAQTCARYHCDKHVVKMILETGQMLSTAYQRHCGIDDSLYKPAYPKHPMTIWVGNSQGNYLWTLDLLGHLCNEYYHRYNKHHATTRILNLLLKKCDKNILDKFYNKKFTKPPLCMPQQYKVKDYIQSYINYYIGEKKKFARYTKVDTPDFML